jgi:hypothetical protein
LLIKGHLVDQWLFLGRAFAKGVNCASLCVANNISVLLKRGSGITMAKLFA